MKTTDVTYSLTLHSWEKEEVWNNAFSMLLDFGLDNEDISFSIGDLTRSNNGYHIPCVVIVPEVDGTQYEMDSCFQVFRCPCGAIGIQYGEGSMLCHKCGLDSDV